MPALESWLSTPLWDQFRALLPQRPAYHPLGCHRPRVPDRVIFDKHVQAPGFGCGYRSSPMRPARPPPSATAATNGSSPACSPGSSC